MKQIWPNYSYSPATNVLTLTGLNIDRDQLLLVAAPERGRIMYNFADSAVTASAYTAGANTALTLVASTAGLTTTASLVIYYDDQLQSTAITISNFPATQPVSIASVTIGNTVTIAGTVTANPAGTQTIAGTVTANISAIYAGEATFSQSDYPMMAVGGLLDGFEEIRPIRIDNNTGGQIVAGTVTIGSALPAGTNRIGVVTIGGGTVTIGAGTAQIGSVTASISGTVPVSISSVTIGNSVTIGSLPAISGTVTIGNLPDATIPKDWETIGDKIGAGLNASGLSVDVASIPAISGTVTIGNTVTASISNSVTIASLPAISGTVTANTFALQGTAVTTSNFTSTTASTVLANYNATREVLTIFNEGAGNLFVCPGATCTTVQYQIRLSSGDYYEVPNHQTTITHSAVFATAGTARVTQVS